MCVVFDRSFLPEGSSSDWSSWRTDGGLRWRGFWFTASTMILFEPQVSPSVLLLSLLTSSIMHQGRSAEH